LGSATSSRASFIRDSAELWSGCCFSGRPAFAPALGAALRAGRAPWLKQSGSPFRAAAVRRAQEQRAALWELEAGRPASVTMRWTRVAGGRAAGVAVDRCDVVTARAAPYIIKCFLGSAIQPCGLRCRRFNCNHGDSPPLATGTLTTAHWPSPRSPRPWPGLLLQFRRAAAAVQAQCFGRAGPMRRRSRPTRRRCARMCARGRRGQDYENLT